MLQRDHAQRYADRSHMWLQWGLSPLWRMGHHHLGFLESTSASSADLLGSCSWSQILLFRLDLRLGYPWRRARPCSKPYRSLLSIRKCVPYQSQERPGCLLGPVACIRRSGTGSAIHHCRILHSSLRQKSPARGCRLQRQQPTTFNIYVIDKNSKADISPCQKSSADSMEGSYDRPPHHL